MKFMFPFAERSASDRRRSDLLWAVQRQQLCRQDRRLCVCQDRHRRKSHLSDWFYLDQCWVCIVSTITDVGFTSKIRNHFTFYNQLAVQFLFQFGSARFESGSSSPSIVDRYVGVFLEDVCRHYETLQRSLLLVVRVFIILFRGQYLSRRVWVVEDVKPLFLCKVRFNRFCNKLVWR